MIFLRGSLIVTVALTMACIICFPAFSSAQQYSLIFDEGLMSFEYDQYPWGSISGTYYANGPVWNDDLTFPNGNLHGSGGVMEVQAVNDTNNVIAMSAIINTNGTIDAAVVFVAFAGDPTPGSFAVELGGMEANFVWLDDATNLTFPEDDDFETWFNNVDAAGKYVGMSGSINVSQVTVEKFVGTFSGRMVNPDNFVMIDILDGVFDITNFAVSPVAPAVPLVSLKAYPNPFNPRTSIFLDMPKSGHASVKIFDLQGRLVRQLAAGNFSEGNHTWIWDGTDDQGTTQAGGMYMAQAAGLGWSVHQKLMYVP